MLGAKPLRHLLEGSVKVVVVKVLGKEGTQPGVELGAPLRRVLFDGGVKGSTPHGLLLHLLQEVSVIVVVEGGGAG